MSSGGIVAFEDVVIEETLASDVLGGCNKVVMSLDT